MRFYFSYFGGKSKELKYFKNLYENLNFKTVVEPFCGSCAFSSDFYETHAEDKKIKYIINDLDSQLIRMLKDVKKNSFKKYVIYLNETYSKVKDSKEEYDKLKKNKNSLLDYVFLRKVFSIRPGLFPTNKNFTFSYEDYEKIDKFIKKAQIFNKDYKTILEKYKNDKSALVFLDPPYFMSYNDCYTSKGKGFSNSLNKKSEWIDPTIEYINILNFFKEAKCLIIMIINKTSLLEYFFNDFLIGEYDVKYQTTKKINKHLIISNYKQYIEENKIKTE